LLEANGRLWNAWIIVEYGWQRKECNRRAWMVEKGRQCRGMTGRKRKE